MDRFNLGAHTRKIRTSSAEAQRWFDLGLNWCFGFNQEEGVKCFRKALEFDPDCVMAHWGIAYGSGPFYNLPWRDYGKAEADRFAKVAFDHLQIALRLSDGREDAERQRARLPLQDDFAAARDGIADGERAADVDAIGLPKRDRLARIRPLPRRISHGNDFSSLVELHHVRRARNEDVIFFDDRPLWNRDALFTAYDRDRSHLR